jgi:DNA topoisomerase IB
MTANLERLIHSDLSRTGIRRQRCGRGFRYFGPDGTPVRDAETLARIKALVIPPAWQEVWICPHPDGHIQAVGTDSAGRRQYQYHRRWREQRDREKHERMLDFGAALPHMREAVEDHLTGRGFSRERVLAAAVRLIDLGFFRPGGEEYATHNGSFGLATIRREHVTLTGGQLLFEYAAKSARRREQAVADPSVCKVIRGLKRRKDGGATLLAYRRGSDWCDVTAKDINDYLAELFGCGFTSKDFRTWHATVLAAVGLAVSEPAARTDGTRKRAIARVVREVADYLGNTPAVARTSYIDPHVIELYRQGITIASALRRLGEDRDFGELATSGPTERAVLDLLTRHS